MGWLATKKSIQAVLLLLLIILYIQGIREYRLYHYYERSYISSTHDYGLNSEASPPNRLSLGSILHFSAQNNYDFIFIHSTIHTALWRYENENCHLLKEYPLFQSNSFSTLSASGQYIIVPESDDQSKILNYETKENTGECEVLGKESGDLR